MKNDIQFGILSPKTLLDHELARVVLSQMTSCIPELTPQKYGSWEPLRTTYQGEGVDRIIDECWPKGDFLWCRKKPDASGSVRVQSGKRYHHSGPEFSCAKGAVNQD